MKCLFFVSLITSMNLLFAYKSYEPSNTLDTHMTPQEEQETGINKLTTKQREALQEWINKNHFKRPNVTAYASKSYPSISEVLGNGKYIRLSDNSLWRIHPDDTNISQSWITPVEIVVEKSGQGSYNYTLTNTLTGSAVRAQPAKSLPEYLMRSPSNDQPTPAPAKKQTAPTPTKPPAAKKPPPAKKPSQSTAPLYY